MIGYGKDPLRSKHRNLHLKVFIFLFILILFLLVYTAFSGNIPLTGNTIKNVDANNSLEISAYLTIPTLELKGNFEEIRLEGRSDSILHTGNQKSDLGANGRSYINLENFEGKIYFDSTKVYFMKGKAEKVVVNAVPLTPTSGDSMKVNLEGNFDYDFLDLGEGVIINEISYTTSGIINLGGDSLKVDSEEIKIESFLGNVEIDNNKFNIEGYIDTLWIKGEHEILISA